MIRVNPAENLNDAIEYASRSGDEVVLRGTYQINQPIRLQSGVSIRGESQQTKIAASGQHAVIAEDVRQWSLANVTISGAGVALRKSRFFALSGVRIEDAKHGVELSGSWCGQLSRVTAIRTRDYAFDFSESCTSIDSRNCLAWGTGGGWRVRGCVYCSFSACACDHCCCGGHPSDPFGGYGGGNYRNPKHIFYIAGSVVAITAQGAENGWSPLLYAEGAQVTMNAPVVYRATCEANGEWRFIELRGRSPSAVLIRGNRFTHVENLAGESFLRRVTYVENPDNQTLEMTNAIHNEGFGKYSPDVLDAEPRDTNGR